MFVLEPNVNLISVKTEKSSEGRGAYWCKARIPQTIKSKKKRFCLECCVTAEEAAALTSP